MKTYQDLLKVGDSEENRIGFIKQAIEEHKASKLVRTAIDADLYASGKNATISKYQKLLYTLEGKAVPDNYTANHKCKSGFFKRFVTQETAFEVGNGVTFIEDSTKERLGEDIDAVLYKAVKSALIQSVSFGFFNMDHVELFKLTENGGFGGFVPIFDEEDGTMKSGIRFWQIDCNKPMRATLYELDGYTDYVSDKDGKLNILNKKRTYKQIVKYSAVDGETVLPGSNYPSFPIVPLYGNMEKQSELVGIREQIDCYDLIKSGFANDLDEASMIYWVLQGYGGMEDIDLAEFKERMHTIGVAVLNGDEGSKAEAHTMDVPYQSRQVYLEMLANDLQHDTMSLDVTKIAAGAVTATQIRAAYEPLNEKCDELEMCLVDFFNGILKVAGIDDAPTFERSMISNQGESIQNVLVAAEYLPKDYITEKVLTILGDGDRADEILGQMEEEEAGRFETETEEEPEASEDLSAESAEMDSDYIGQFGEEVMSMLDDLLKGE